MDRSYQIVALLIPTVVFLTAIFANDPSFASEHLIHPGDVPQNVLDRATSGDRIVFLPGLHQHKLAKHRSLLYVDKSIEIELQTGATLKLADGETTLESVAEITTDHGAPKKLDDLSVGVEYDLGLKDTVYAIVIDGEGKDHNYMETDTTSIEPNFQLDGYEVIDNIIKSNGQAIHCWRKSTNGVIADNIRIADNTGKPVVVVNAPGGWENPQPPILRNNRNHLGDNPK